MSSPPQYSLKYAPRDKSHMISQKGVFYEVTKEKKLLWTDEKGKDFIFQSEQELDIFVEKHSHEYNRSIPISTTDNIPGKIVKEYKGIVYASSSELAGYQKQQTRIVRNVENVLAELEIQAIKIGANAVIGVQIAANNSTGMALNILGSSDSITLIATAVIIE